MSEPMPTVIEQAKVRIGIITRNRAKVLPKALESALGQNYPYKQITAYDIASTDSTPQIRNRFPQVEWRRSETRLDMISPKNDLMRNTDADFYFSLDDDAWFLAPDQLTKGVGWMQQNPKVAILAYDILLPGMNGCPALGEPRETNAFIACGALLRRSALEQVGYYDVCPAIYGGGEETDLCLRLMEAGYMIQLWPGLHIWHERTQTGRDSHDQHRSAVCNQLAYVVLRCPASLLLGFLPWKMFHHFLNSLATDRLKSYAQGIVMFLKSMPALIRARAPVSRQTYLKYLRLNRSK
jgi:GT2 family glycosyltransferase